jgi:hypothetical protein
LLLNRGCFRDGFFSGIFGGRLREDGRLRAGLLGGGNRAFGIRAPGLFSKPMEDRHKTRAVRVLRFLIGPKKSSPEGRI